MGLSLSMGGPSCYRCQIPLGKISCSLCRWKCWMGVDALYGRRTTLPSVSCFRLSTSDRQYGWGESKTNRQVSVNLLGWTQFWLPSLVRAFKLGTIVKRLIGVEIVRNQMREEATCKVDGITGIGCGQKQLARLTALLGVWSTCLGLHSSYLLVSCYYTIVLQGPLRDFLRTWVTHSWHGPQPCLSGVHRNGHHCQPKPWWRQWEVSARMQLESGAATTGVCERGGGPAGLLTMIVWQRGKRKWFEHAPRLRGGVHFPSVSTHASESLFACRRGVYDRCCCSLLHKLHAAL